jgi:hypothetical protein
VNLLRRWISIAKWCESEHNWRWITISHVLWIGMIQFKFNSYFSWTKYISHILTFCNNWWPHLPQARQKNKQLWQNVGGFGNLNLKAFIRNIAYIRFVSSVCSLSLVIGGQNKTDRKRWTNYENRFLQTSHSVRFCIQYELYYVSYVLPNCFFWKYQLLHTFHRHGFCFWSALLRTVTRAAKL